MTVGVNYQRYVLGFLFSEDMRYVTLIRKLNPVWQRGKLNGIGGKVEPGELIRSAMIREFKEETGVATVNDDWRFFTELHGRGYGVFCYAARNNSYIERVRTTTDETVLVIRVEALREENVLGNLKWLVPMAIDRFREDFRAAVHYGNV